MTSISRAARAADLYTRTLGWSLIEIPRGSKGPRRRGWQQDGLRDADTAFRYWSQHPACGMGLLHGESGTATLDADTSADHIALALEAVGVDYHALLAEPGPQLVGNPAKPPKLLFRVPPEVELGRRALWWPDRGEATKQRVVFELRSGRVQDVLPPTMHPDTGNPYRWIRCPAAPDDVPVLPPELVDLWTTWPARAHAMLNSCPWAEPQPEPPTWSPGPHRLRPRRPGQPSTIETFNELVPVHQVLDRNGYTPVKSTGRWIAPGSTTGTAGVVELDGRVYSHHASDALADGHAHDSFSAMTVLEHGGDMWAALRSARLELGLRVRGVA